MKPNDRAASALIDFGNSGAQTAADAAAAAFERAGRRIENALIKAARTGELSFKDMAESILQDLARIAVKQLITSPIEDILSGGSKGGSNGKNSGNISGQKPAVNITMNVSGVSDARGFSRSQGQISAAIARAVSDGQRFF